MISALIHFPSHFDFSPITSLVQFVAITSSPRYHGQETNIIQGIQRDDNDVADSILEEDKYYRMHTISHNTNPYRTGTSLSVAETLSYMKT
jgi:hypothetical protein